MNETRSAAQEAAEDIFFGQVVTSWARWLIIAAGIVVVLWSADDAATLVAGTVPVVALMAMNFYLHGRQLSDRPANRALITFASALDLGAITVVVLIWPGQVGLQSQFFVLYYPVVLAFAFVMGPRVSVVYTMAALVAYSLASYVSQPDFVTYVPAVKALVGRLITIGAMGGLGAYYWRIQRNRRRTAVRKIAEPRTNPTVS